MRHTNRTESELALYASGDLPFWARLQTSLHVRSCAECRELVDEFRLGTDQLRELMDRLPSNLDIDGAEWRRLSAEMTANIHLGIEAGECVAPVPNRAFRKAPSSWRPALAGAAIALALMVVIGSAWWLNVPASDVAILQRAFGRMVSGPASGSDQRGPLVEASSAGIEFRENGGALGMNHSGSAPVATSVSFEGSASAHYVDDAGQVTVNTVYMQ